MNSDEYIVRDAAICDGEPVVKDTRVTVRTILASLAERQASQTFLKIFQP